MALSSTAYFSNAIVGQTMAGADVNVTEVHATPRFALGTGFVRQDGNIYRYAYTDAAVAAGAAVAPVVANSGQIATTSVVLNPASTVAVAGEVISACAIGSHFVELTLPSIAANQWRGGYLILENGSGAGYTYRIKGNTATGNPASTTVRIQLYEALKNNIGVSTNITIVPCPWNDITVASTATNWAVCGVMAGTTTTANPFGWVCTHGTVGALHTGTMTGGHLVSLSPGTSTGQVAEAGAAATTQVTALVAQPLIGYTIQPATAAAGYATIFLTIE